MQNDSTPNDATPNDVAPRSHPHYGTCAGCRQLKHVSAQGLIRDHNQYRATRTIVSTLRCAGSGTRYLESRQPAELSA